ncbi:hypothetical protein CJ480_14565 [Bacillus subtilis]|nr:hypothetical protein CJ480_14565 [Bacillus subtilis]
MPKEIVYSFVILKRSAAIAMKSLIILKLKMKSAEAEDLLDIPNTPPIGFSFLIKNWSSSLPSFVAALFLVPHTPYYNILGGIRSLHVPF